MQRSNQYLLDAEKQAAEKLERERKAKNLAAAREAEREAAMKLVKLNESKSSRFGFANETAPSNQQPSLGSVSAPRRSI